MDVNRLSELNQLFRDGQPVVLPSLLQCDFGNLEREIRSLEEAGIRALHLDVMDGHFVPNFTYGMPIVKAVRQLTELTIDVHLMISQPSKYISQFVDAGADYLTIHAEISEDVSSVLEQIRHHGVGVGLAVNPATHVSTVAPLLGKCDLFLSMSVEAGFGGQTFDPIALEKLRFARENYPELLLEVDGGVNMETAAACTQAGAMLLVVGSAIFGHSDYGEAIRSLRQAFAR
ncbi:MAG: ribulose-phosphate 3-epimerase [Planctomycetales bacterium]|nr:ribulose-phosphate 3-epimerase [Planctomycetales bacterium]